MGAENNKENKQELITKTILLKKDEDDRSFVVVIELLEEGRKGAESIRPLSWGHSITSLTAKGDEYQLYEILEAISKQHETGSMKSTLELLTLKGKIGLELNLTESEWDETRPPLGWYLPPGETLNIPLPQLSEPTS